MVDLHAYIAHDDLTRLIAIARREDLGPEGLDVTTQMCVPADLHRTATIAAREPGVLAGAAALPAIARAYDDTLDVTLLKNDGASLQAEAPVARIGGSLRSLLTMERVALNVLGRLSGIATSTAGYVEAVAGSGARILDTRKTLPGLRGLEKYAVACGGGWTHRMGLYDAMLIKDNHLAHMPPDKLGETLGEIIEKTRVQYPHLSFIEVEVDKLDQLARVLSLNVDIALLDNMTLDGLRQAVTMRDERAPDVALEASGGVNLNTVRAIAETGVDRISVGALTHSARALDLGMDLP
jgi:nicotinate-nucleotide pyrophosphorylase (carboxylating)